MSSITPPFWAFAFSGPPETGWSLHEKRSEHIRAIAQALTPAQQQNWRIVHMYVRAKGRAGMVASYPEVLQEVRLEPMGPDCAECVVQFINYEHPAAFGWDHAHATLNHLRAESVTTPTIVLVSTPLCGLARLKLPSFVFGKIPFNQLADEAVDMVKTNDGHMAVYAAEAVDDPRLENGEWMRLYFEHVVFPWTRRALTEAMSEGVDICYVDARLPSEEVATQVVDRVLEIVRLASE
jgi:hypothetical protein